jgi:succinoglycan biosynthesis transport protein ExoP
MDPYADESSRSGSGFDPLQLIRIFWRRKWLFFVPFILCLAMAGVAVMIQTPIFFSSGQIRVIYEPTSSNILPNDSRYGRRNPDADALYNIETIVTGPKFLERVAQEFARLHPEKMPGGGRAQAAGAVVADDPLAGASKLAWRLRSRVRVRQEKRQLYSIGIRDTDPERAYLLTQVLLDRFLEEERASRVQPRTTTRDFLEGQRQNYQENLNEKERRLTEFERSMLSESLAGNPVNEANLSRAEAALNRLRSQYFDADTAELFTLERLARSVLGGDLASVQTFSQDPDIAAAMRELVDLEYQDVLGQGTDQRQTSMGTLRLHLNELVEDKTQQVYPALGVMERNKVSQYLYHSLYRDVQRRIMTQLEQNIKEFRDFMTRQPEQSAALARLRQEAEAARNQLQAIERDISQENLRIEASLSEIGYKMVVHEDPYLPNKPIEPDKVKLSFMGFVLALALGGGLVVLAELLDRSFRAVDQIEKMLGLQVIGTMPIIASRFFQKQKRRRLLIWLLLVLIILAVAAVGLLLVYPRLS